MIRTVLCSTLALLAGSAVMAYADAKEDATNAAQKLSDASNYSWKTESENAGGGGPGGGSVEGKTEKDGYTALTMNFGNNSREIIRKGDKVVIHTDNGWETPEEIAQAQGDQNQGGRRRGARGGNVTLPAAEAQRIIAATKELQQSGDVISGDLSEEGVKSLMAFGRGRRGGNQGQAQGQGQGPQITNAKGEVKFWVENGVLSKMQYHVTGSIALPNGDQRDIDRTTTVAIKDVGNTKVEVPDEAKKKLGE